MSNKYAKNKGRSGNQPFVMLRYDIMDSEAWQSLSSDARCIWLMIVRRFNGMNNGQIPLSCREAAKSCKISPDTANRAIHSLIDRGLIKIAENSGFNMKQRRSRRWTLTHHSTETSPPTNEWKKFKIQSEGTDK